MNTQIRRELWDSQVAVAVEALRLLADPTRLRIIWALLDGEHAVGELAEHVGAQPPAVSQHLARLRLTRVVRTHRDGTRVLYAAENAHLLHLAEEALFHADHVAQELPDHGEHDHRHDATAPAQEA